MLTTGEIVRLAEWIIDDTCHFSPISPTSSSVPPSLETLFANLKGNNANLTQTSPKNPQ